MLREGTYMYVCVSVGVLCMLYILYIIYYDMISSIDSVGIVLA